MNSANPRVSIAIPVYPMKRAQYFLTRCLDSILGQTFEDFEVFISDNSDDDSLEKLVKTYGMKIRYFKNPKKGISANTNEALKRSTGHLVKFLYMDDYFSHKNALAELVEAYNGYWLVCGSDNNRNPHYTKDVYTGNNRIGSPSALMILNKKPLLFDESLTWLLDCDFYKRMYDEYGLPTIMKKVQVNIGIHEAQMTNLLTDEIKIAEYMIMKDKYGNLE